MMKSKFLSCCVTICILLNAAVFADQFTDNFNTTRNYLASGVSGSGWDGFIGQGTGETVDTLNANSTRAGKLYIQSHGGYWESPFNPLGPFLYRNVDGDFTVTVKAEEVQNVSWNCTGIMARVGNVGLAGDGEDFEAVYSFPAISANVNDSVDNGAESESTSSGVKTYLRLRRVGNTFYHEVSSDGTNWTLLPNSPRTRDDMSGLVLQVGIQQATYNSNSGYAVYEDFSLTYWPPSPYSRSPDPMDGADSVPIDKTLTWGPGYGIDSHDVYFGTNYTDVNNANNGMPVGGIYKGNQPAAQCGYDPGTLQEGFRYYWRIDERIGLTIYKGQVWTFKAFTNCMEDFEGYANSSELTAIWAPAGTATATLATDVNHTGEKSMRLCCANASSPYYASVTRTLNPSQDWTANNLRSISIYFRGSPGNSADKLYLIIEDSAWQESLTVIEYDGDPNNLKKEVWTRWDIGIQQLIEANPALRLTSVKKITLALGNPDNPQPGGSGCIYIDDISLHTLRCIDKNAPLADFNGDCVVDMDDVKILAQNWLTNDVQADAYADRSVDFKDLALVANKWMAEYEEWPQLIDADNFLTAVPFYDVNVIGGLWGKRIATDRDVTIPHCWNKNETTTGRLDNFYNAINHTGTHHGYVFNDSDIYKTLEATAYSLRLFPDPSLEAYADDIIDTIGAVQWADGYLDTLYSIPNQQPASRWTNEESNHETYCAGHLFESAIAYYQTTGKEKILDIATRFADEIDATFGVGKLMDPPGHQIVESALVWLYHQTGEQRYFDLAKFFIDQRGNAAGHSLYGTYSQDHIPFVDQTEGVGHAVRACYLYTGVADVARENLDQAYMNALLRVWDNIVSCKTYITGGLGQPGGPEGFTVNYDLGNDSYCETCASIAFAIWNHRMFLLTGDGKYLDMMERSMLNNILSGISITGDRFFYPNRLATNGETRPDWYDCACCPPNEARFIMSIGGRAYAYKGNDVYVTVYINGTAQVPTPGNNISLIVDTNYPWDGDVNITVNPQHSGDFAMCLRVPEWARGKPMPGDLYEYVDSTPAEVQLKVNSVPIEVKIEKGFVRINRNWQAGDTIELNLPMPVRRSITHPSVTADIGLVTLERGPVVYCAEFPDVNSGNVKHVVITDDSNLAPQYRTNLLNSSTAVTDGTVLTGTVKGAYKLPDNSVELRNEPFTAIPYFAWAHRGFGPMAVWLARDPNKATPLTAPVPPVPPVYELYGWWKFNESGGTTAFDSSDKGKNGTLVNGPVWTTGYFGNALQFDGTNLPYDYVDLPDGFDNFQAGVTINVWAYPTAAKNYARFVDLGNGQANDNIILGRVGISNDLFAEVWIGSSRAGSRIVASGAISLSTWQMFTVTVDASGNTKIYRNAVLTTGTGTTGVPQNVTRVNNYIGKSNWNDAYYEGKMDNIRIYSYPLNQADITALYNSE
jgi:DUF1680 family protein/regulation of enolase protein 1 (concanavalin A-like superfamily)